MPPPADMHPVHEWRLVSMHAVLVEQLACSLKNLGLIAQGALRPSTWIGVDHHESVRVVDDLVQSLKRLHNPRKVSGIGRIHVLLTLVYPIGPEAWVANLAIGYADAIRRLHNPDFDSTLSLRVIHHAADFLKIGFVFFRKGNGEDFHEWPQVKKINALRPSDIDEALPVRFFP